MALTEDRTGMPPGASALPGHPELSCSPLDDRLADQLVARTIDPQDGRLRAMTSDLARFSSRERLDRWRKSRQILCLLDPQASLLGVVWVGEKPLPQRDDYLDPELIRTRGPRMTFAIRLYGAVRGCNVSFDFAEFALHTLLSERKGPSSLWFQTKADNGAARNLGKHMDFVEATGEEGGTVVGIRFRSPIPPDQR